MNAEPREISEEMLSGRADFEHGMPLFPLVSILLILLNVAAFSWEAWCGLGLKAAAATEFLAAAGAKKTALIWGGEWWRLASYSFLHGSPGHLIGNMAALYVLGMGCEHAFGRARTLAIYVWTGIGAGVVSCLRPEISVGASGAVFGLLGALGTALHRHRDRLEVRDKRTAFVLIAWAIYSVVMGAVDPWTDNLAHAGGLLLGVTAGLKTDLRLLQPEDERPVWTADLARTAGLTAAALAYAGWFFLPALAGLASLQR
ncbi:MAG: hypothetical protein A2X36_14335 [Elusimicrobia bacterium GWA2_69_24]|nr:MAG: hypothetical protein A2X36_14335 [Elusimicrobia bacterium GWA2_69_24]